MNMNKRTYNALIKVAFIDPVNRFAEKAIKPLRDIAKNTTYHLADNELRMNNLAVGKVRGGSLGSVAGLILALRAAKDKSLLEKILYGAGGAIAGMGVGSSVGDLIGEFKSRPSFKEFYK